ncbi:MAG: hypothetical protein AB7T38_17730 [Nitrospirales bacterium]
MGLTYKIQEAMEWQRETEALRAGVPQKDIDLSRRSGIDAMDVRVFREFSGKGFLIVVRCPKIAARAWHGLIPPKPISIKQKSGSSGVAVKAPGHMRVSDYDLMSLWRQAGAGWRKVFASAANGAPRGSYSPEATSIIKALNQRLVSRIQHGCQDDYCSPQNPGVSMSDHFVGFSNNVGEHLANPLLCKMFYEKKGLVWLYNSAGGYLLDVARQTSAKM